MKQLFLVTIIFLSYFYIGCDVTFEIDATIDVPDIFDIGDAGLPENIDCEDICKIFEFMNCIGSGEECLDQCESVQTDEMLKCIWNAYESDKTCKDVSACIDLLSLSEQD